MDDPAAAFEHRAQLESVRREKITATGELQVWFQHRYMCRCGNVTPWYRVERRARLMRDAHALDGQLSLPVGG